MAIVGSLFLATGHCFAQQYVPVWIKTSPPASGGRHSSGTAMIATPSADLVIGGSSDNERGQSDYLAIKYNSAGDVIWKTAHASQSGTNNVLASVSSDPLGNILLTGSSDTVKLDASGSRVWSAPFSGRSLAVNSRYAYLTSPTPAGTATLQLGNDVPAPVDIILDCDPGADPDDMSDLAILNNLMSRGELNVIGIMGAHRGPWISISIDVMKRYYGHPNIPVGIAQDGPIIDENYGWYIRERYGSTVGYDSDHPDSIALYRSILASRPDGSVTIVFTGELRNLFSLWNSGPDAASPLFGPALLAKKVRQILIVAGIFPDSIGAEWNMLMDIEAAQVLNRLTDDVFVTYVGIELGNEINIPLNGVGVMDPQNPVRYAHEIWGAPYRPSWSGLALLVAARGLAWNGNTYFTNVPGHAVVRTNGSNSFVEDKNANHRYLRKTQSDSRYIEVLDDLLLLPPPNTPQPPAGDQTGQEIWMRPFNVQATDEATLVRVNQFGEVFVGGVEVTVGDSGNTVGRFALAKYGEAASLRWRSGSTNVIKPARTSTELRNMAIVGDSIWLFGRYGEGSALFKFSANGQQLWNYNFPADTLAAQMVVDDGGTAYVANTMADKVVATRIDKDGAKIGESIFQHSLNEQISLETAALDTSGSVYFAGGLKSADKAEVFLIRFTRDLSQQTVTTYPSRYMGDARAIAMAIQSSADVYLTGYMPTSEGGSELFTMKFTPALQIQKIENGPVRLKYRAAPSQSLTLEATYDFSQWQPVATGVADAGGLVQFEDTNVVNLPVRFYRTKTE